jgi:hypothetical protein
VLPLVTEYRTPYMYMYTYSTDRREIGIDALSPCNLPTSTEVEPNRPSFKLAS